MRAWIAGATGVVGQQLLDLALADPRAERVVSLVRRPAGRAHARLVERVVAFDRLQDELAGEEATAVFCCLGTTMAKAGSQAAFRTVDHDYPVALGRAALAAGAGAFLLVSAVGADPGARVFYSRVKGETERDLAAIGLPALHVFRPSLILADRPERRLGEKAAMAVARPLAGAFVGPLARYRPIPAATVARAMLGAALDGASATGRFTYEYPDMIRLARLAGPGAESRRRR